MPEKYYLDYFNYLMEFVERQYDHILDNQEYAFYEAFRGLSEDAKCLYLRFSNRRGNFFRLNKIAYAEIVDLPQARDELMENEFIRINATEDLLQFRLFTKSELLDLFDFLDSSQKKEDMLLELSESDVTTIHEKEEVAEVLKNEEVAFLKLLFFGHHRGQMTDFVVRDVGNVKIEQLDESKFKPWFQTREEAQAVLQISKLRQVVYEVLEAGLELTDFVQDLPWSDWLQHPRSSKSAGKLLLKIAYHFEQVGDQEEALRHYAFTDQHPSRERRVRLLEKLERKEKAIGLARMIMDAPANASEATFATDYLRRSGVRINRSMTERLKNAPSITITKDPSQRVEDAVICHFEQEGWQGVHAENFIWRGLFGLIFWEEIFDESHGSFHHPLQRQPSDLNDPRFFESRVERLNERLHTLTTRKKWMAHLSKVYEEKDGTANRFVIWHELLLPALHVLVEKLPLKGLKKVLTEMSRNMKHNSAGFPDLFIWKENKYQFYEVKSPNDQLSAQQLFWLDFLATAGIRVEVLRVYYGGK